MKKNDWLVASGEITDIIIKGLDFPNILVVVYRVDGIEYQIEESIKYKSKLIKVGIIPVGQKKVAVLGDIHVGGTVDVCYNPNNPKDAFLRDNVGRVNV